MDTARIAELTIRSKTEGVDAAVAKLNQLAGAEAKVTVEQDKLSKVTESYERRLASLQRRYDPEFKASQEMARAQTLLNGARSQGLVSLERQDQLLGLVTQRFAGASRATSMFHQEAEIGTARTMALQHSMRSMIEQVSLGVSPIQALTGQMSHLSFVFSGGGGLRAAAAGVFSALLSPISLITIGLGAASAAASMFFSSATDHSTILEDALKRQRDLLADIRDRYGEAVAAASKLPAQSGITLRALSESQMAEGRSSLSSATQGFLRNGGYVAPYHSPLEAMYPDNNPMFGPNPQYQIEPGFAKRFPQLTQPTTALLSNPNDLTAVTKFREELARIQLMNPGDSSLIAQIRKMMSDTADLDNSARAMEAFAKASAEVARLNVNRSEGGNFAGINTEANLAALAGGGASTGLGGRPANLPHYDQMAADLARYNEELQRSNALLEKQGDFFGGAFLDGVKGLEGGFKGLVSSIDSFASSLADAVLQAAILGKGPLAGFGGMGEGGGLFSWITGGRFSPQTGAPGLGVTGGAAGFSGAGSAITAAAGGDVQSQIWKYWSDQGLHPSGIAAIMGNQGVESAGFKPGIWGDNHNSYGLFQYQGSRLREMQGMYGQTPGVIQQNEFAKMELMRDHPDLWNSLTMGGDVKSLTKDFGSQFERPADLSQSIDRRVDFAGQALDRFGGKMQTLTPQLAKGAEGLDQLGSGVGSMFQKIGAGAQAIPAGGGAGGGGGLFSWVGSIFSGFGGTGGFGGGGGIPGLAEHGFAGTMGAPFFPKSSLGPVGLGNQGGAMAPVVIHNYSGAATKERTVSDGRGGRRREIIIGEAVASGINSRQGARALQHYGVEESLVQS